MAFVRSLLGLWLVCCLFTQSFAQTIYYPQGSSRLLKETAADVATLLQKATSSAFNTTFYSNTPATGIVFSYDSTITDIQLCKISVTNQLLVLSASQDNGLIFGIYQYLADLGFKFYQPGDLWEVIPTLNSVYIQGEKNYSSSFKYKTWFITGGHSRWAMDNTNNYNWDSYFGENGHNWAVYQRRNGMLGAERFSGHRSDIMTAGHISQLQANPCYVAPYNGSRQPDIQSVPDVNQIAAMDHRADAILSKYITHRNNVMNNKILYADLYRNFNYIHSNIGIEVSDGAHWANGPDASCSNFKLYSPSDQNIILANHTTEKINNAIPGMKSQVYAYSSHADVPGAGLEVHKNLQVQVASTAFQTVSSPIGLLNRWYKKHNLVSEYHYLNITQWGGETPMFWLRDLKQSLQRLKDQKSQGIVWEASPAKFASLPFLKAANSFLLNDKNVDSSLMQYCQDMYGPAALTIFNLHQQWTNEHTVTMGGFMADNKYKIPLYLQILQKAMSEAAGAEQKIQSRLYELKAYLHYLVLYYDWFFDQRTNELKTEKAARLCVYLARINKLQLVNSYYLITDISRKYPTSSAFYQAYNPQSGTAYQGGNLPLITNAEIEENYQLDLLNHNQYITNYKILPANEVIAAIPQSQVQPLSKISVKLGFTNGAEYPNRSEFFIHASKAGNFKIDYNPSFGFEDKGNLNFAVEDINKSMSVISDHTIENGSGPGSLNISLPGAGTYKLSMVSQWKTAAEIDITTNNFIFFRNTAFLGSKTENYRSAINSLPGYYFVPTGISKVFFSVHNAYHVNGTADARAITKAFLFKDDEGNMVDAMPVPGDSSLFYIDIPANKSGKFWQVFKMEQYDLCFANINNILFYAERKSCSPSNFTVTFIRKNENCQIQLKAVTASAYYKWEVYDNGKLYTSSNREFILPENISADAWVSLSTGNNCSNSRLLKQEEGFFLKRENCAMGAALPLQQENVFLFPNPSTGLFKIGIVNGLPLEAINIQVFSLQGQLLISKGPTKEIDLSKYAAGAYFYQLTKDGKRFSGKLVIL